MLLVQSLQQGVCEWCTKVSVLCQSTAMWLDVALLRKRRWVLFPDA